MRPDDINKIAEAVVNRQVPWVDPNTGQVSTQRGITLGMMASWIENTVINNPRLQNIEKQGQRSTTSQGDWLPYISTQVEGLATNGLGNYLFVSTKEEGKIYVLAPGIEPLWLSPEQWELWRRLGAKSLGPAFTEAEMRALNDSIQPKGADADLSEEDLTKVKAALAEVIANKVQVTGTVQVEQKDA